MRVDVTNMPQIQGHTESAHASAETEQTQGFRTFLHDIGNGIQHATDLRVEKNDDSADNISEAFIIELDPEGSEEVSGIITEEQDNMILSEITEEEKASDISVEGYSADLNTILFSPDFTDSEADKTVSAYDEGALVTELSGNHTQVYSHMTQEQFSGFVTKQRFEGNNIFSELYPSETPEVNTNQENHKSTEQFHMNSEAFENGFITAENHSANQPMFTQSEDNKAQPMFTQSEDIKAQAMFTQSENIKTQAMFMQNEDIIAQPIATQSEAVTADPMFTQNEKAAEQPTLIQSENAVESELLLQSDKHLSFSTVASEKSKVSEKISEWHSTPDNRVQLVSEEPEISTDAIKNQAYLQGEKTGEAEKVVSGSFITGDTTKKISFSSDSSPADKVSEAGTETEKDLMTVSDAKSENTGRQMSGKEHGSDNKAYEISESDSELTDMEKLVKNAVTLTPFSFMRNLDSMNDAFTQQQISTQTYKALDESISVGRKSFIIKLSPEGLGEITVKLIKSDEGILVKMMASDEKTAQLLNRELDVLQNLLKPHNAELETVVYSKSQNSMTDMSNANQQYSQNFRSNHHDPENRRGYYKNINYFVQSVSEEDDTSARIIPSVSESVLLDRIV